MSIKLMAQVWERDVSGTDQSVLLILCDHANDHGGSCYPSIDYVAWKLGVSPRTVMRALARLEESRAITVRRTHKRVNKYQINLSALPPKPKFLGGKMSPKQSDTADTLTTSTNHQEPATPAGPGRQAKGLPGHTSGTPPTTLHDDAGEYGVDGVNRMPETAWPSGPAEDEEN